MEWVALDLETTGLDSTNDRIIEIGAVRFTGDDTLAEFQTFVQPDRELTQFIRDLTGITQADVDSASPFERVSPGLADFARDATIVGHNANFDLSFLQANGLWLDDAVCDTWELAYLVRPSARSYALEALARSEGISAHRAHRALDDAHTTRKLFLKLIGDLGRLPPELLQQITLLSRRSNWDIGALLESARQFSPPLVQPGRAAAGGIDAKQLSSRLERPSRLRPALMTHPPNADEVARALSAGSDFSNAIPGFEERAEQIAMARAVANAIDDGGRLMVEAGTGVGKSLAYLLPAAIYATKNDRRVVVSTNTINLQEQLVGKDLPMVKEALSAMNPELGDKFRFTQLKGRNNYICYKRWQRSRSSTEVDGDQARLTAKTMLWMQTTETGDRSDLNIGRRSSTAWRRLSAERAKGCPSPSGPCFLQAARNDAAASHITVVNHALLMSGIAASGNAMPEYDVLIVDEAQHLEDAATDQFGSSVDSRSLDDTLETLIGERGLFVQLARAMELTQLPQTARQTMNDAASEAMSAVPELRETASALFSAVASETMPAKKQAQFSDKRRIEAADREDSGWTSNITPAWENLDITSAELIRQLSRLLDTLEDLEPTDFPERDSFLAELEPTFEELSDLISITGEFISKPSEQNIYWVERAPQSVDVSLNSAPLHVGEALNDNLYSTTDTIVLTSATLSVDGSFDHVIERIGFTDAQQVALGSPFDFRRAALLYTPREMPAPNSAGFQSGIESAIVNAATAASGRTMALFTSHNALRATASAVRGELASAGIRLLAHGIDGSREALAERFADEPKSVLFGASSFWEGVDFAGDALSVLIVVRLPFAVPTDPVFEARSENYGNPFMEYAVPQAVIRFRQGFGRLIRTGKDRGVAMVLDSRIVKSRYGKQFIDSLPDMINTDGKGHRVSSVIERWLEYTE